MKLIASDGKLITEKLTAEEKSSLAKCEETITKGLKSFVTVGKALEEIRDRKLYRETHKTFEAYVQEKWGLIRRRAYQIMEASNIVASLPANRQAEVSESKAAALAKVQPNKRVEVLDKANKEDKARGKKTAVAKTIKKVASKNGSQNRKSATNEKVSEAQDYSLKMFEKKLSDLVDDFVKHKLPISTIITTLHEEANDRGKVKIAKAS